MLALWFLGDWLKQAWGGLNMSMSMGGAIVGAVVYLLPDPGGDSFVGCTGVQDQLGGKPSSGGCGHVIGSWQSTIQGGLRHGLQVQCLGGWRTFRHSQGRFSFPLL